ncbi:MAG: replication-relaxation family protein [Polyangiaceae bacterium]|nr:replication-relaxation family protein [Polyangiaceae bacterium]
MTRRDRDILHAVGRMGQATTDQIQRLYFGDRSTASRRLAKLVALRMLDVHVPNLSSPNVYTLGKAGLDMLLRLGADRQELHVSRVRRHLDEHLRALNDLRVGLVVATRARMDVSVEAFHGDLDLRRAAGAPPPAYLPDAVVELVTTAGPMVLIVEIDLGFETRGVFAKKVDATVALWTAGLPCCGAAAGTWRPAVFVLSEGRARSLAAVIERRGGGPLWLVAELQRVLATGALAPVLATAEEVSATPRGVPLPYRWALAPRT